MTHPEKHRSAPPKRWLIASMLIVAGIVSTAWLQFSTSAMADDSDLQRLGDLRSTSNETVRAALRAIEKKWHPGEAVMLLESARFAKSQSSQMKIIATMSRNTGQKFATDTSAWYRWIWSQPYEPHPDYAQFKGLVYGQIDSRFTEYFIKTDSARIRLDEIRWGGVRRDGIPPLQNPQMIFADEATYLDDSNAVFGIEVNGEARCYPKRILAWHEMFKDTIGGQSFCGVY